MHQSSEQCLTMQVHGMTVFCTPVYATNESLYSHEHTEQQYMYTLIHTPVPQREQQLSITWQACIQPHTKNVILIYVAKTHSKEMCIIRLQVIHVVTCAQYTGIHNIVCIKYTLMSHTLCIHFHTHTYMPWFFPQLAII